MPEYKQVIILRKDLKMSPGKAAAQACHASLAFLSKWIKENICLDENQNIICKDENYFVDGRFSKYIFDYWIKGIFTKTIVEAKNKNQLLKIIDWANEKGLKEDKDYFLIKDNCLTELTPEEIDNNGVGKTLTCIGFRPLPMELANEISHKYHLYM